MRWLRQGGCLRAYLPGLAALAVAVTLVSLPLFQGRLMSGHDSLTYPPRSLEFYHSLRSGALFPRWAASLNGGYGEPYFNFSPPLLYYLTAGFHAVGFNIIIAGNLAAFALVALAGVGMYRLGSEFFGSLGGLVSAVGYLFAPYFLAQLYVRQALTDFAAFAFIPFALWGLYRWTRSGGVLSVVGGSVATALVLLSANPVALITLPALGLLALTLAARERSWRALGRGAWLLSLGLGLAAYFWLPALVERDMVQLWRVLVGYLNYTNHYVYPQQLLVSPWGYGLSLPGPDDGMSFAIGPIHLLVAAVSALLLVGLPRRFERQRLIVAFFLAVLVLAAFFSTHLSSFFWNRLSLLQYLEFPWRFHSLIAVSSGFLCGFPVLAAGVYRARLGQIVAATLTAVLLLTGLPHARPEYYFAVTETDFTPDVIRADLLAFTTAGEYRPVWAAERPSAPAPEPLTVRDGVAFYSVLSRAPEWAAYQVEARTPSWLRVNTLYFPGWTVTVDGATHPTHYDNPQGVFDFYLDPGKHDVTVVFAATPVRRWGAALSGVTLLLLTLTLWLARATHPRGWR